MKPKQYNARHYFPGMARIAVPVLGIVFGIVWSLSLSVVPGVTLALLYSLGMAWSLSWLASRRKPIASFQEVIGSGAWRYADLSGQYEEVARSVEDLLRTMCTAGSVGEYGIPGMLVGEIKATFWTWGSELLGLVERLDPAVTRVQVLSRPLVPMNVFDFGANKRLAARFINGMRRRYADLSIRT
jgi:hypothetical protein